MTTAEFLDVHGLSPSLIDVKAQSDKMLEHMLSGINGQVIDMPMIKTFLTLDGTIEKGRSAAVIDAGGTNFRAALATYTGEGFEISNFYKDKMPGTEKCASWDEFISFTADAIEPFMDKTDIIGFCFSYSANITPEKDGIVNDMDKEVIITGCKGRYVGKDLTAELARRGFHGKKCVVLNDTVAALLGNSAFLDKEKYSGFMGMICGTGINTCASYNGMLINLESGFYSGMPQGDFDKLIDATSAQCGEKLMEKMCSGAYIGSIAKLALDLEGTVDGRVVNELSINGSEFQKAVCSSIFERSARCMASNIIALMKLTGCGKDKPYCVCAEGSLIGKSAMYLEYLEKALEENSGEYKAVINVGSDTTLPGSAAAALLNT